MKRTFIISAVAIFAICVYGYGSYHSQTRYRARRARPTGPAKLTATPKTSRSSSSLKCGSTVYSVSTGNNKGNCTTNVSTNVVTCTDGAGNKAIASCLHGCTSTSGSGSCNTKP